jgi:glycosyltransferase involved in cell wall biosynthesis
LISIVIPTRNRPDLLKRLVETILRLKSLDLEIVVVDSSDLEKQSASLSQFAKVKYVSTRIQSAAVQRNIGLENLRNPDYVFFLDDDVLPSPNYFKQCLEILRKDGVVGVSGLAINTNRKTVRTKPQGVVGIIHRIFLLDSVREGIVLKSGVNIPVREVETGPQIVEWLIGCSGWRFDAIGDTRFEADFAGQSLAEDVIFSVRMSEKGLLVTDPRIVLLHDESVIERPNGKAFWHMWIKNRFRLIKVAEFGIKGLVAFWWANLGQLLILTYSRVRGKFYRVGSISGIINGALEIIWSRD